MQSILKTFALITAFLYGMIIAAADANASGTQTLRLTCPNTVYGDVSMTLVANGDHRFHVVSGDPNDDYFIFSASGAFPAYESNMYGIEDAATGGVDYTDGAVIFSRSRFDVWNGISWDSGMYYAISLTEIPTESWPCYLDSYTFEGGGSSRCIWRWGYCFQYINPYTGSLRY